MTLYHKLQTFTQGQKTGKGLRPTEGVLGRKKSGNYCYKRSYMNGSGEFQKSKRKYNSVNVSPGDLSGDQTKSFSKLKDKRARQKKAQATVMEKKLKVIVGPTHAKASQSKKKSASKRVNGETNLSGKGTKTKMTDKQKARGSEEKGTPLAHLNVVKKYIQLEKKFGIKSKSIGRSD